LLYKELIQLEELILVLDLDL